MPVADRHAVLGTPLQPPFPEGFETAVVGMGCFWGAERVFWQAPGVYTTAVGYAGGFTPNPTYEEVCCGRTGPRRGGPGRVRPREDLLRPRCCALFWENHDPTQGMRQGNDVGTQYRSAIYSSPTQRPRRTLARRLRRAASRDAGYRTITTEIAEAGPFYYAEDYHQQYLAQAPERLLRARRHRRRAARWGLGAVRDPRAAVRARRRARGGQPPATAGRIVTSSPS